MDKTTQNLIWFCLPHEGKKEVKRQYRIAINSNQYFTQCTLEYIFGYHNLTSDTEGEEMLTVSRKRVQDLYNYHKSRGHHLAGDSLIKLFGSKCLPDEANVETSDSNVDSLDPKPSSDFAKIPEKTFISKWDKTNPKPAEPKEDTYISPAPINFDDIERRDRSERRLNIAAMAMQGILANSHQELVDMKIDQVAKLAVEMTDALMAEAEKGGLQ